MRKPFLTLLTLTVPPLAASQQPTNGHTRSHVYAAGAFVGADQWMTILAALPFASNWSWAG